MTRTFRFAASCLAVAALLFPALVWSQDVIKARIGTSLAEAHPQTLGARKFAELVEKKTSGRIKISVHPAAELGNDVQMQAAVVAGTQEFTVPSSSTVASLVKEFGILGLPFAFSTEKQADSVLDGPFGKKLMARLPSKNVVGLAFWENGFRNITNSKKQIDRLEDIVGLRVRTMQNNQYIDLFNGLGAEAVPMPVNELFTALESGKVDAQENPYTVIHAQKLYNVQRFASNTRHAYDVLVLLGSKKFMDSLSVADQAAVQAAANEAKTYQRETSRQLNAQLKLELTKMGMKINDVSYEERERMRRKVQPVFNKYASSIDLPTSLDFVTAILNAPR